VANIVLRLLSILCAIGAVSSVVWVFAAPRAADDQAARQTMVGWLLAIGSTLLSAALLFASTKTNKQSDPGKLQIAGRGGVVIGGNANGPITTTSSANTAPATLPNSVLAAIDRRHHQAGSAQVAWEGGVVVGGDAAAAKTTGDERSAPQPDLPDHCSPPQ